MDNGTIINMKNLFKNAYFGKPYKTRGQGKAILINVMTR